MDTPERAALIKAWATHLNVTHGSIMRDVLDYGLNRLITKLVAEHGLLPEETYDAALKVERERGAARSAAGAESKRNERKSIKAHRVPVKRAPRKATKAV